MDYQVEKYLKLRGLWIIIQYFTQYLDGLLLVKKNSLYFRNMKFRYSRLLETLLTLLTAIIIQRYWKISFPDFREWEITLSDRKFFFVALALRRMLMNLKIPFMIMTSIHKYWALATLSIGFSLFTLLSYWLDFQTTESS